MEKSILKNFMKYVSLNILGMIGISCYILADTFFVSKALGATGLAALNLSISLYSVIHGFGLMIGIGGASRYSILMAQGDDKKANAVFSAAVKTGLVAGLVFMIIGLFGSSSIAQVLGADQTTLPLTRTYLTTILSFAPFFILNNILLAFVRNDHNPRLSMVAMLTGSFANIILDYVFMFPLKMGMFGAAFATGLAPIISLGILLTHFTGRKHQLNFYKGHKAIPILPDLFQFGLSAFIIEISSAVVLITFNLVILGLEGNLGIAAYGIIANLALVVMSVFTGLAQGIQPLISKYYGSNHKESLRKVLNYAFISSMAIALMIYLGMLIYGDQIIQSFNSEKHGEITQLAKGGMQIYFLGFFFAGVNIVTAIYLSATEAARDAFLITICRGLVIITPLVFLLSRVWGMKGVWLSFLLTELIVMLIAIGLYYGRRRSSVPE